MAIVNSWADMTRHVQHRLLVLNICVIVYRGLETFLYGMVHH